MLKRILSFIAILLVLSSVWVGWKLFGPATGFQENKINLFISSNNTDRETLMREIRDKGILNSPGTFAWLADRMDYWSHIHPGKYEIRQGMNLFEILRMLRNGSQTPVKLVINKFRTREELAGFIGRQMECDSLSLLNRFNSPDSAKAFGLDTNNILTLVIPNTYTVYWNTPASKLLLRLQSEQESFWTEKRKAKLVALDLDRPNAYILASIIEEETNKNDEKPLIASVYLNRLKKNMRLSADPTVKFALRDFGLKRITLKHIQSASESPYNTYLHAGLPPGPICTPSIKSIDAVLDAEKTGFLFFCAKPDFSGYHNFAATEGEHMRNAKAYQKALDSLLIK